jgi:hypothetical protein
MYGKHNKENCVLWVHGNGDNIFNSFEHSTEYFIGGGQTFVLSTGFLIVGILIFYNCTLTDIIN